MNDGIRELLPFFFFNNKHFVRDRGRDKQAPVSPHV